MKITAMITMALMAGAAVQAKVKIASTEHTVVVCMSTGTRIIEAGAAQQIASKMFADIAVAIVWHSLAQACPVDGIQVSITEPTPESSHPGALAYAMPYEGTHIVVLYDRIARYSPGLRVCILAHVLVHEITHILQGVARHSDQGVMKGHWDESDYYAMRRQPLAFTKEDIDLIHAGLAWRSAALSRRAMATNSAVALATSRAR